MNTIDKGKLTKIKINLNNCVENIQRLLHYKNKAKKIERKLIERELDNAKLYFQIIAEIEECEKKEDYTQFPNRIEFLSENPGGKID
jgi:hypothetical protein